MFLNSVSSLAECGHTVPRVHTISFPQDYFAFKVTHPVFHSQDHQVAVSIWAGCGFQGVVIPSLPAAVALSPLPAPSTGLPPLPAPAASSSSTSSTSPLPASTTTSSPMPPLPAPTSSATSPHPPAPAHWPGSAVFPAPTWFPGLLPPLPATSQSLPLQTPSCSSLSSSSLYILGFVMVTS